MTQMHHNEVEMDLLMDVNEELHDMYDTCEEYLIRLEKEPDNVELQRSLFRSIHTIKGDLQMVEMTPLIPLLASVEDLLGFIREGEMPYTSMFSDLLLLVIDRVKVFIDDCIGLGETEYDKELFDKLCAQLSQITPHNPLHHEKLLESAVTLLDPSLSYSSNRKDKKSSQEHLSVNIDQDIESDLDFFSQLMTPVEQRSQYWKGRTDRIVKLALLLNKAGGSPVDESQLAAACYVHDFGMAFMPLQILHKNTPLTIEEYELMCTHVESSAKLLENMSSWKEAHLIVAQHHERVDGKGYPHGLTGEQICEGAKIIAVVDTFEAMTHHRAHTSHQKRPIVRAMAEINQCADKQLSSKWILIFQRMLTSAITHKK